MMPTARHDGGDEKEQRQQGFLATVAVVLGAFAGYWFVYSKGMTENPKVGDYAAICGILIGACVGMLVYGLCRIFLRR